MAITPTRHIFVYGSLLSVIGHPNGERLAREAQLVGSAKLSGQLLAISWYPGAVDPSDAVEPAGADIHPAIKSEIRGEVYLLNNPDASLAWLDAYEGIDAGSGPPGEFFRATRPVRLDNDREMAAWVYLYRGTLTNLPIIPSGYWPDHGP